MDNKRYMFTKTSHTGISEHCPLYQCHARTKLVCHTICDTVDTGHFNMDILIDWC